MDALLDRTEAFVKEVVRQNTMEEKRKAIAEAAKAFVEAINKNKADLEAVKEGEPEEKIEKVKEIYGEGAALKEQHDNLDKLDADQKSAGVKENKLSPVSMKDATSLLNKHDKFYKNLLKALEDERIRNDRRKERQAEQEKKEALENKRNDFIDKSADIQSWMDNSEEELSSDARINSLEEMQACKESFEKIKSEKEEKQSQFEELNKMAQELQQEGADIDAEAFANKWNNVANLIDERANFISEEEPKQQEIDKLRHEFADCANELQKYLDEERAKEPSGELEEQLKAVNTQISESSEKIAKAATTLSDTNEKLVDYNVRGNPYTDLTVKGLKEMSESFKKDLEDKRALLEQQISDKNGSKASPEEIEEFRELFHTFAKSGDGLKWFEFKAVLSALGEDISDDDAKARVNEFDKDGNGEIDFQEFMDFMIKRREEGDSPEAIVESFREIAGGKDYITEAELAPHLTPAQLEHVKKTMPKKGDGYDYTKFTKDSFNQ